MNTSLILGICFIVFDTLIYLFYCVSFWKKINHEKKLITDAKSIFKNQSLWNFIVALSFAVLPTLLVICVVLFSLINAVGGDVIFYMASAGYVIYTVLVLTYLLIISFGSQALLIFIYGDSIIFMNEVVKLERIFAFDYNASHNHIYLNYLTDEKKKEMIKLRNRKKIVIWLKDNFDQKLFVE